MEISKQKIPLSPLYNTSGDVINARNMGETNNHPP